MHMTKSFLHSVSGGSPNQVMYIWNLGWFVNNSMAGYILPSVCEWPFWNNWCRHESSSSSSSDSVLFEFIFLPLIICDSFSLLPWKNVRSKKSFPPPTLGVTLTPYLSSSQAVGEQLIKASFFSFPVCHMCNQTPEITSIKLWSSSQVKAKGCDSPHHALMWHMPDFTAITCS